MDIILLTLVSTEDFRGPVFDIGEFSMGGLTRLTFQLGQITFYQSLPTRHLFLSIFTRIKSKLNLLVLETTLTDILPKRQYDLHIRLHQNWTNRLLETFLCKCWKELEFYLNLNQLQRR